MDYNPLSTLIGKHLYMSHIKVKEISHNVHEVRHIYKKGWEQWYLLGADAHLDHPKCVRKVLFKDFEEAKRKDAKILMFGDTNCLMQGRSDKRGGKGSLREEHKVDAYFDAVVNDTADILSKYPVLLLTEGNHETSVNKIHETDIVRRVVDRINMAHTPEQEVYKGGYSGYVMFRFEHSAGGHGQTIKLWYHHGYGGGGEVTGGIIQSQRRAVYVSDADLVVSGHVHESVTRKFEKIRLSKGGKIETFTQKHIILPTYKDEFEDGKGGWHVETGKPPKPIGGVWLRFYCEDGNTIKFEIIERN